MSYRDSYCPHYFKVHPDCKSEKDFVDALALRGVKMPRSRGATALQTKLRDLCPAMPLNSLRLREDLMDEGVTLDFILRQARSDPNKIDITDVPRSCSLSLRRYSHRCIDVEGNENDRMALVDLLCERAEEEVTLSRLELAARFVPTNKDLK